MILPYRTLYSSIIGFFGSFDIRGPLSALIDGPGLFTLLGMAGWEEVANGININNTYFPLLILSAAGLAFKNGLYIFLLRQFFRGVPDELEESAYIDGSGTIKTFISIILPLSVPMLITVFLFSFSWQWTDIDYTGMFFTSTKTKLLPNIVGIPQSLSLKAEDFAAGKNLYEAAIRNTCGLMIIAPLVVVYVFCQKFLVQGIERSGLTAD